MTLYALASLLTSTSPIRVHADGHTLVYADGPNQGRVVSVQPDGHLESRDPGTAGGYETCCFSGNGWVSYDPDPSLGGPPYLFALVPLPGN